MRDYEEKSYYEIQLDNKQLILVFLAGVTVCVLVFILGVMVGKGRQEAEFAAAGRNEKEGVVRPEPDLAPPQEIEAVNAEPKNKKNDKKEVESKTTQDDPAYYDLANTNKEKPLVKEPDKRPKEEAKIASKEPEKPETKEPEKTNTKEAEKPTTKEQEKKAEVEPVKAVPLPEQKSEPESTTKGDWRYTVQVMATSSKSKAEQQLSSLQSKGYTAYMDEQKAGEISVFKVRVGQFNDRDSALKTATRIKQELQLDTWVAVLN